MPEDLQELRLKIARYAGSVSRLCGILGITPQEPTDETLLAALKTWMDGKSKEPEKTGKGWDF